MISVVGKVMASPAAIECYKPVFIRFVQNGVRKATGGIAPGARGGGSRPLVVQKMESPL
jgi:hypothetical protein